MSEIVTGIVVGLIGGTIGASLVGFVAWRLVTTHLVKPHEVFNEPQKKRSILVPGDGVYVVQEKRKCRFIDEQKEWAEEQNKAR